jgi:signal transduction histidine kinase/AraC-like DNA-binding protein
LIVRHSCGCLLPSIAEAVLDESNGTNMACASDGGNPISRDEKPDLAGVLAGQRRGLLSEMAHAAGGSPFAQIEAARLLNGLVGELQHGTSGAFLSALDETLNQVAQRGERIKDWQSAISVLHRRIQPYIASGSLYARASDLWHQARVMIAEASWRNQSWKRIQNEEQERRLRDFGARLATVLEEEELAEVLARELPDLGVPRGLLSVYTDPRSPSGQAQLFMGCDSGGRLRLQAGEEIFPAPQLAPERFWMDEERFSMLVQPLYLRDLRLGFMLLETEGQASSRESVLWEALHTQISGALASVMLHREAVHARREAEAGWKLAEERRREAEDANQLKSRFLSMVSHEMRTPLNVIAGLSESLIQQSETHDPVSEDLAALYRDIRRIYASAQHLDNLIRDVLDLAVSQVGQLKILREPLDVAETILPVIELGERLAGEKHLTWQVHLEPDLPPVLYDRTRLRQILINLVTNAVKFTDQGSVELSVARSDGEVRFSVRDTGLGIAPEEQSMIFEEFRRSERAGARGYGGMGLGLAICRRLVEMGGGKIRVESSGEVGGGSTFTFAFPELTENTPLAAAPSSQVLVLHDQENSSLVAQLGAAGFQVEQLRVTADTAWHAFILTAPPAAVVLEFSPDNSLGAEIAAGFKNDPVLVNIPILFCTLESGYGALYELKTLQKPVAAPQLVQALEREGFGSPRDNPCPILVVDDEPGNLDLHARLIERHLPGCRVQRAHNGREALEVMRAEPPGLVLLDLMMPEMNGFDVLEAMRLSETLRAVPVIVLTSQKLTEREMQLLNQGVQAVLQKGIFSAEETLAHLKAALRRGKHLGSEARRIARLAMAFIHEHYRDPIARKDLAEAGGVSQEYLSTCFHRETGITPSEYLERYRIQQARRLLETTDLPVTRVALEVGFYDSSYFGRVFRREVGVTPVAYRRGERQG